MPTAGHSLSYPSDTSPIDIAGDFRRLAEGVSNALDAIEVLVDQKVTAVEQSVSALTAEVARLRSDMTAGDQGVTSRIAAVESSVASLSSKHTSDVNALSTRITNTRGYLFSAADSTTKTVGTTWGNAYSFTWTMPHNGHLLVVGECELNDQASVTGDPQARLVLGGSAGPVSTGGIARGSLAVTITVPLVHSVSVNINHMPVTVSSDSLKVYSLHLGRETAPPPLEKVMDAFSHLIEGLTASDYLPFGINTKVVGKRRAGKEHFCHATPYFSGINMLYRFAFKFLG